MAIPRSLLADLSLMCVGMIWGLNFTLIKSSIQWMPPMQFIGLRFLISAVVLFLIFYKHLKKTNRDEVLAGCVIGIFLFLGFLSQTTGLQYTTPGKSGLITSFYIVIVPFIASVLRKKFVGWIPISGALIAFIGLCMISVNNNDLFGFNIGNLLTLLCAFFYALHILAVEHYTPKHNMYILTMVQIGFTAIMSLGYSLIVEPVNFQVPSFVWESIIYTGLLGTCFAFLVQNIAQRYTSSSHTALLLGLEAPFALLFSVIIWGEILTARGLFGSTLIFMAIILVLLGPTLLDRRIRWLSNNKPNVNKTQ
ncbi:MAG TPA: EamA family transporter [Desulfosporosinus sp.]|jgi:drug/metabolite transporter (DMT)-like permease|nr:EamA family transporter [Desulfosporosinus sp.]